MTSFFRHSLGTLVLAVSSTLAATGQDYSFGVPKLEMHAVIHPDASAKLIYDITFQNMPGAHPIDIVDIGVAPQGYSLGNVRASIGGRMRSISARPKL